ncbi:response regulator UvrY [mine drainage metagenome]|uniref:Response regulator UvrY n=1 Tax=mine drainage metagenome TaxID=410659 RepID=A0A1J5T860_9ZZZZ|nr:response regulator transcription factor [Sideroxydans sp. CL21]
MIRVLIVDDHTIFRSGLKRLFSDENDISVVDEASNSTDALDKIRKHELDLVLMDVSMAGRSGLEALESLRIEFPQLPVLILSMYSEEQYAVVAMKAGANGYLSKDAEPAELIGAIRKIAAGGRYLTNRGTELMLMQFSGKDDRPTHQKLSTREFEIMRMIANGISLTEIGERLNISVKTVSTYRTRILEKIGVKSNAELAKFALRNEIV